MRIIFKMARINNPDTIKRMMDDAKIQTSTDAVPQELASKVVPVLIANPGRFLNVVEYTAANNASTATIFTTPTGKDFYVTSISLSFIKDVNATSTYSDVRGIVGGRTLVFLRLPQITLTAQSHGTTLTLPFPMKMDRGSVLTVNNSAGVGEITATACITGYTVEA